MSKLGRKEKGALLSGGGGEEAGRVGTALLLYNLMWLSQKRAAFSA